MQRVNSKVVGILVLVAVGFGLAANYPSWAQAPAEPTRQETKPKSDAQAELQRAADELAKIQHQIDYFKAIYASKAANLAAAKKAVDQQPKTIEQRLTEIETKLDTILATLGKKGPAAGTVLYWQQGAENFPYMAPGNLVPPPVMAPPPAPTKEKANRQLP